MSDAAYCLLGAEAIEGKITAIMHEMTGVRQGEDIEYLHRMRVATRRLRSALSLFRECLGIKEYRRYRKTIRKVTRSLGEARDTDVQIAFLESHLQKLEKGLVPGTKRVLLRLRQKRELLQVEVEKVLDRMEKKKVLSDMHEAAETLMMEGKMQRAEFERAGLQRAEFHEVEFQQTEHGEEPNAYVYNKIEMLITPLLDDLLSYEAYVSQPEEAEKLHAMRIAAKKLRYALEFFEPLYEKDVAEARQGAKKAQTLLGDLHDCDVWAGLVQEFLISEKQRTVEYFGHVRGFRRLKPGIVALGEDRRVMRVKVYEEFVEFWEKMSEKGVWEKLREALKGKIEKAEE